MSIRPNATLFSSPIFHSIGKELGRQTNDVVQPVPPIHAIHCISFQWATRRVWTDGPRVQTSHMVIDTKLRYRLERLARRSVSFLFQCCTHVECLVFDSISGVKTSFWIVMLCFNALVSSDFKRYEDWRSPPGLPKSCQMDLRRTVNIIQQRLFFDKWTSIGHELVEASTSDIDANICASDTIAPDKPNKSGITGTVQ
jgi:hypothetical protein